MDDPGLPKHAPSSSSEVLKLEPTLNDGDGRTSAPGVLSTLRRLVKSSLLSVETHGIAPTTFALRADKRMYHMFLVWFTANMNILNFSTGTIGPAAFGLGLRDSTAVIVTVNIIVCTLPAFFATFGPKLGMRAMVQCRYSWGYYGAIIPSVFNVLSMQGFLILNCIVGGQILTSISDQLTPAVGIVIVGVISLAITFCGYKVVHWYASIAWVPTVIAFIIMVAVGGHQLPRAPLLPHPTAARVISFISTEVSATISWCTMTPDYGVYHDHTASVRTVFLYSYLGFLVSCLPTQVLGAAFAAAAPAVPAWAAGFEDGTNLGGLVAVVLAPVGGFGKFLVVLLALSITGACAPTMYTFGTSLMAVAPALARVPRAATALISTAILIPVGIVAAAHFYTALVTGLSAIGYWAAPFSVIVLVEHFLFRRAFRAYNAEDWEVRRALPRGVAACIAFAGGIGAVVPAIGQSWYTGPLARRGTGDIGVFMGFAAAGVLYAALRPAERRWHAVAVGIA